MKSVNEKSWKSLLLISLIVPLGLLSTLKLTGVLQQPAVAQTINLDPVTWNMTRPNDLAYYRSINKAVANCYNQSNVSANFTLFVCSYTENNGIFGDFIQIWLMAQVETPKGGLQFLEINSSRIDDKAYLHLDWAPELIVASGLRIDTLKDSFYTDEPYIHAYGLDNSTDYSLQVQLFWSLLDEPNSLSHNITLTMGTTCFNGTDYIDVNLPIQLNVVIH